MRGWNIFAGWSSGTMQMKGRWTLELSAKIRRCGLHCSPSFTDKSLCSSCYFPPPAKGLVPGAVNLALSAYSGWSVDCTPSSPREHRFNTFVTQFRLNQRQDWNQARRGRQSGPPKRSGGCAGTKKDWHSSYLSAERRYC